MSRGARVPPVAVVGSGLAARVAALRLKRAGVRVAWLDLAPAAETPEAGGAEEPIEAPLPLPLPGSAPALLGLAAELGLGKSVRRQALPPVALVSPYRPAWLGAPPDALDVGPRGLLGRRRARRLLRWYGPYVDAGRPESGARLDDRSVADWCRLYLGRGNLHTLYGPCLAAHFGLDGEETSRLMALHLLDPAGRPQLGQPVGLSELSQRIGAELADVRRSPRVRQVLDGGRRLRLESGRTMRARATVLGISADRVAACAEDLTPAERAVLPRIGYVDRLQLALRVPRRLVPRARVRWVPGAVSGPLAAIVAPEVPESLETLDPSHRELVLVARPQFAARAVERADADVRDTLLYAAEQLVPGLCLAVQESRLWRGARSVAAFGVGHYRAVERLHREREESPERALFLCGGYMVAPHAEGDVVAGTRIAQTLLSWSASRW